MNAYIASSWRNRHAVDLVAAQLRSRGWTVKSFVENCGAEEALIHGDRTDFDFDAWVASDEGAEKFRFDLESATTADLVVYIGPSGTDAWAEVGAAWQAEVRIHGLYAKGEPSGLMRRMVVWHRTVDELLAAIPDPLKEPPA